MNRVLRVVLVSVMAALVGGLLAFAPSSAAPRATLSGTVTGPSGASLVGVSEIRLDLMRKTRRGWQSGQGEVLRAGETDFAFRIALPGTYAVRARPKTGAYGVTSSKAFRVESGRDVSGVTVALKRSAAVAGMVVGVPIDSPRRGVVQLWRRENERWVAKRTQAVPADGTYVFGVKPGTFRVTYDHRQGRFWAPRSRALKVQGRATVTADLRLRDSRTISGALTRVGFTGQSWVSAEVRTARGWQEVSYDFTDDVTYSVAVPGARPRVRLSILGGGPDAAHPRIFWNGSTTGVLAAKRAKIIDLGAGSAAGVDFTVRAYREFETTVPLRIVGSAKVGATLKAAGAWSPKPTRVRYYWRRGGDVIDGANGRTYRLRKADRGRRVWVSVEVDRGWYRPIETYTRRVLVR